MESLYLRLPEGVKKKLKKEAHKGRLSMNQLVCNIVAQWLKPPEEGRPNEVKS
jgi:hypothetical protein